MVVVGASAAGGAAADQPLCNDETFEVPAASAAGASADQAVGDGGLRGFLAEMRGEPTAPELAQRVRLLCRAIRAVDLSAAATDAESQTAVQALAGLQVPAEVPEVRSTTACF